MHTPFLCAPAAEMRPPLGAIEYVPIPKRNGQVPWYSFFAEGQRVNLVSLPARFAASPASPLGERQLAFQQLPVERGQRRRGIESSVRDRRSRQAKNVCTAAER